MLNNKNLFFDIDCAVHELGHNLYDNRVVIELEYISMNFEGDYLKYFDANQLKDYYTDNKRDFHLIDLSKSPVIHGVIDMFDINNIPNGKLIPTHSCLWRITHFQDNNDEWWRCDDTFEERVGCDIVKKNTRFFFCT